jgi:hypothetical protein
LTCWPAAPQGGAGTDVLSNINEARGSAFNDTLAGSNRTDVTELFEGREGDDMIDGRGGFDIVRFDNATERRHSQPVERHRHRRRHRQ